MSWNSHCDTQKKISIDTQTRSNYRALDSRRSGETIRDHLEVRDERERMSDTSRERPRNRRWNVSICADGTLSGQRLDFERYIARWNMGTCNIAIKREIFSFCGARENFYCPEARSVLTPRKLNYSRGASSNVGAAATSNLRERTIACGLASSGIGQLYKPRPFP